MPAKKTSTKRKSSENLGTTTPPPSSSKSSSSSKKMKEDASGKKYEISKDSSRVDTGLVERAVMAMLKHHQKQQEGGGKTTEDNKKKNLFADTDTVQIHVNFALDIPPTRPTIKPRRIMIPHPLYKLDDDDQDNDIYDSLDEAEICLIVKEESKPHVQEMIEKFPKYMKCIKKVMGLDSLRKKHSSFQQKRALMKRYTLFMADDRILNMLTQSLGTTFIKAKKQPIPIAFNKNRTDGIPMAIYKALQATYLIIPEGTCVSVRAGNTGMPIQHLIDNITTISNHVPPHIPRSWSNIQGISIKTAQSVSLPIYNKTPYELQEITKMAGLESVWKNAPTKDDDDSDDDSDDDEKTRKAFKAKSPLVKALKKTLIAAAEESTTKKQKNSSATKKRKMDDDDDDVEIADTKKKQETKKETTPSKSNKVKENKKEDVEKETSDKKKKVTTPKNDKNSRKMEEVNDDDDDGDDDDEVKTPKTKETKEKKKSAEKKATKTPPKKASDAQEVEEEESKSTPVTKKAKTTKETKDAKVESSKKKTKKDEEQKSPKAASDDNAKKEAATFIAAKKFKGSKSGYVFQVGSKGLGYYIDKPPVVDEMVLKAIARMGGRRRGSSGGGGSGGKRNNNKRNRRSF